MSDLLPLCSLSRPSPRGCPYVDHSTVFHLSAPMRGKDPTVEGTPNLGIREGEKGQVSGVPRERKGKEGVNVCQRKRGSVCLGVKSVKGGIYEEW